MVAICDTDEKRLKQVSEKPEPIATAEHGVKVVQILEGRYKSAEKGREVR